MAPDPDGGGVDLPRTYGEVLIRAYSEFVEMPGLRLTVAQAGRLLGADQTSCVQALDVLVDAGFLRRTGEAYGRAADGPRPQAALRMPHASLESIITSRRGCQAS
jgi:hypothetical protein